MSNPYSTPIPPEKQKQFEDWFKRLPKHLQNNHDYDIEGAFMKGLKPTANEHFDDTFKKPNHMTFSSGSIYSKDGETGGEWKEDPNGGYVFFASPTNLKYHSPQELVKYFDEYEPESSLILPWEYSLAEKVKNGNSR